MQTGDKVVATGNGERTKLLNGGDIVRSHGRGGFDSLVSEGVQMTVISAEGFIVKTKYYKFDSSDLRVVSAAPAVAAEDHPSVEIDVPVDNEGEEIEIEEMQAVTYDGTRISKSNVAKLAKLMGLLS